MARSYFCDHCKHAMAKGGRVTLNIAVNEPHKAPFPLSFTKELCPLCYETLMVAIVKLCQNLIKFRPLILSKQVLSLTARVQQELTKPHA